MSSYKTVVYNTTVADAIETGFSELEELASECQEASDNFPNSDHPKAQAFADAASELEGKEAPEVPEGLGDLPITVHLMQPKSKKRVPGRSVRRDNAINYLSSAKEALEAALEEKEEAFQTAMDEAPEGEEPALREAQTPALDSLREHVEEACEALQDACDSAEGVEFPGMFG